MALNIYTLQHNITNLARSFYSNQPTADEARARFKEYISALQLDALTKGGARRYPKKTEGELHRLWMALADAYTGIYCVFGYWYKGEFYTTYKGARAGLKTTKVLHNLEPRLSSAQWDSLESGLYYKDSLKKYY